MKSLVFLCAASLGALRYAAAQHPVKGENPKRPVTVADSIQSTMTMLDDYRFPTGVFNSGVLAQFSPDGKKVIIILRKGNIEQNTNEYSLLLFRTEELLHSPEPQVLLTMSSSSNHEAIKDLMWLDDSKTVAFLGEHPGEPRQLYTFNIRTHTLRKRTKETTDIASFSLTPKGDQFAYVAEEPVKSIAGDKARREGSIVSQGDWISDVINLGPGSFTHRGGLYGNAHLLFQSDPERSRRMEITDRISEWSTVKPFLSPDGKYIVIALQTADIPESWKDYSDPALHGEAQKKLVRNSWSRSYSQLRRYVLVDTNAGKSRVLLNSPLGRGAPGVAWSPDGHSVAVSNVYLPLDNTDGDERKTRQSTTFAVEVRIPSGEIVKITQEKVKLLRWDAKANRLVFEALSKEGTPAARSRVFFEKSGENWEKVTDVTSEGNRPEIVQEEDMNTPPRLFAVNLTTHRKVLLLDLNPQFKNLTFGRVEEITWNATDGHKVKGGLYYPVDYVAGQKYPSVIQTHGWESDKFRIDGTFPTAFAAQELAGKGIMVVQADEGVERGYIGTTREAPGETSAFEGLIDDLAEKGMIDRERVGIIGFSRTVFHVKYALTHSRYHFAAASVTDGFSAGYAEYGYSLGGSGFPVHPSEAVNGGPPFGDGLKLWLERAPDFSIDKLHTPVRIVSEHPGVALMDYPWYTVSIRLGKPVEMVTMQDGEHYLRKPWERIVASQGNVDWFCFWLKGEEDPDPAKTDQYKRWRELRKLHEENLKKLTSEPKN